VLSFSLPHKVDSAKGEARAQLTSGEHHLGGHRPAPEEAKEEPAARPGLRTVGPAVLYGLGANAALRFLSGFLTLFLAFLLREQPLGGLSAAFSLGVVAVAAGTGNAFGTALGSWLRARPPEKIIATALLGALAAVVAAAAWYGPLTIALVAAVAGISQALSKLSLDATIQRDVPEEVRTSAFARSETALQLAWVIGGALGIVLPLNGTLGMSVAATVVASGCLVALLGLRTAPRRGAGHPRAA
jgi:energy-converting hydrogenase Eha subunit C